MAYPRLTETAPYPLDRFDRCQLCGKIYTDVCSLRMWYECDDNDVPEQPPRVLVICRAEDSICLVQLEAHPRAYLLVPWRGGAAGHLQMLCGPCTYRNSASCTHPDLKTNGGQGLDFTCHKHPLAGTHISYHEDQDESGGLRCTTPFEGLQFLECKGRVVLDEEVRKH